MDIKALLARYDALRQSAIESGDSEKEGFVNLSVSRIVRMYDYSPVDCQAVKQFMGNDLSSWGNLADSVVILRQLGINPLASLSRIVVRRICRYLRLESSRNSNLWPYVEPRATNYAIRKARGTTDNLAVCYLATLQQEVSNYVNNPRHW